MIKYDGEVVYSESGAGLHAKSRMLFNEAQVSGIKSIVRDEIKEQTDSGVVYVVEDTEHDDCGELELVFVFEDLQDAQQYVFEHRRAVIMPRKVIKHGQIKKQK